MDTWFWVLHDEQTELPLLLFKGMPGNTKYESKYQILSDHNEKKKLRAVALSFSIRD